MHLSLSGALQNVLCVGRACYIWPNMHYVCMDHGWFLRNKFVLATKQRRLCFNVVPRNKKKPTLRPQIHRENQNTSLHNSSPPLYDFASPGFHSISQGRGGGVISNPCPRPAAYPRGPRWGRGGVRRWWGRNRLCRGGVLNWDNPVSTPNLGYIMLNTFESFWQIELSLSQANISPLFQFSPMFKSWSALFQSLYSFFLESCVTMWDQSGKYFTLVLSQGWGKIYCQYIVKLFTIINIQYNILLYNKYYL